MVATYISLAAGVMTITMGAIANYLLVSATDPGFNPFVTFSIFFCCPR